MIIHGDARRLPLADESVDCVVTSPPYFMLREYGSGAGEIGREASVEEYVETMVACMREVGRVLKESGTLWLNLGDSYTAGGGPSFGGSFAKERRAWRQGKEAGTEEAQGTEEHRTDQADRTDRGRRAKRMPRGAGRYGGGNAPSALPRKCLMGIPWRVALALMEDGWILRSDIVWFKENCMPESVQDRPTRSHEFVFLLARSPKYFYDAAAIREPMKLSTVRRLNQAGFDEQRGGEKDYMHGGNGNRSIRKTMERVRDKQRGHSRGHAGFNARWDLMTKEEQAAKGCNARDVWVIPTEPSREAHFAVMPARLAKRCIAAGCPEGGLVLDPFCGSGTVVKAAQELGRRGVGMDLNGAFCAMAKRRSAQRMLV